ncbi:MAG: NAD-dependent epimerase/dehydratase family protein, partial [Prevotella sp.]|nr:NAD-dependent epimerase/dehydratase family protein [Prevotella sp.]
MALDKNSKIYVAGHRGLVGSAIWNNLKARGYNNLVGRTHSELDLTDQNAVKDFFDREKPDAVVLAAAFVGGIMANSLYRADFIMQNMKMQCNVISNAYSHGVKKLLFLGSTCIYPKNAPQPMKEDALLTSPLEYTNEEYAIAKIAGLKMCESYNLQYGTNYIAVMPTNLYGPNDNFHLENSHVMPAMMRKIYLAKLIHDGDWQAIRTDMDKRPVNPDEKLKAIIGEGNVDGKNSQERILKALE